MQENYLAFRPNVDIGTEIRYCILYFTCYKYPVFWTVTFWPDNYFSGAWILGLELPISFRKVMVMHL